MTVHSVVSPVTQTLHCFLSQADGGCSRYQVTWLEYLIFTGEERDQLYLSSAYLLPLYNSTLKLESFEPGLHLNPSTAGQLSPLSSLYFQSGPSSISRCISWTLKACAGAGAGQRLPRMLTRAENSGSEMFMSHIVQSTTYRTDWVELSWRLTCNKLLL